MWKGINGDIAMTLDSHYYLGCGNRGGREREIVYWVAETDDMEEKTFNQISQSAVYVQDDKSVSLTVCGGSYGGGSEVLVLQEQTQVYWNNEQVAHSLTANNAGGRKGCPTKTISTA